MPDTSTDAETDTDTSEILSERLALGITFCVLGLAVWGLVQTAPYQLVLVALVLAPPAAMILAGVRRHTIRVLPGANDARSNVAVAFVLPGLVLSFYAISNIAPVDWTVALGVGAFAALAVGLVAAILDRPAPKRVEPVILLILLSLPYGYGATQTLNAVFDTAGPAVVPAEVLGKQHIRMKFALHHVVLGPWGGRAEAGLVRTSKDTFAKLATGDVTCLSVHPGALGVKYMSFLAACPAGIDISGVSGTAPSSRVAVGLKAFERGDHTTALLTLKRPAENGHTAAQFALGMIHWDGVAVRQDLKEAMRFFRLAANRGDARSMNALGYIHANGIHGAKDEVLGLGWYRKAAAKNERRALNNLGIHYQAGRGVPKDMDMAKQFWLRSAALNHGRAMINLGSIYADGDGVKKDRAEALRWWRKSLESNTLEGGWYLGSHLARAGASKAELAEAVEVLTRVASANDPRVSSGEAAMKLALLYREGRGVPKGWSEQIKWLERSVALGYAPAEFFRGVIYDEQKQPTEALDMYRRAAAKNYARGQAFLGLLYEEGERVPKSLAEAIRFYRLAAAQGDALGQQRLGYAYDIGQGVKANPREAARLYRLAADQGDGYSAGNLGLMYLTGRGIPRNFAEGHKWTSMAAKQNQPDALNSLAVMHDRGTYVGRDVTKAIDLYRRAAAFGHPNAAHSLAGHYYSGRSIEKSIADAYYWALIAEKLYAADGQARLAPLKRAIVAAIPKARVDHVAVERQAAAFAPLPAPDANLPDPKPYTASRQNRR